MENIRKTNKRRGLSLWFNILP